MHRDLPSPIETKYLESEGKLAIAMEALRAENFRLKNKQEALVKLLR